jgi:ABC-2 type transport system permease protein
VSILFSILFRSTATSALAALAVWIFFSFFVGLGANVLANALVSDANGVDSQSLARRSRAIRAVVMTSPLQLYTDATATIIDPTRKSARTRLPGGPMENISMTRFSGPLPLIQSILVVAPYIFSLVAVTIVCFAVSYAVFMKQEIRSL